MKGKFDTYVLRLVAKKFQNWVVDRSTTRDFTVYIFAPKIMKTRPEKLLIIGQIFLLSIANQPKTSPNLNLFNKNYSLHDLYV